jgi:predicted PurR-regulated permease PerM
VIRAVVMLGLTIALLGLVAASGRVIGWVLAAATLAGLLHPLVVGLSRKLPRGLALAIVVVGTLAVTAGVAYRVVDDVSEQIGELQKAIPRAARELERSDRFGDAATEIRLAARAQTFVDELPERLRGGDVQDALRSAATRGVAFLATGVLTIFFLIHGPRLLASALAQLPAERREGARRVALAIYRRSWRYVSGSAAMSAMAGLVAYGCAEMIDAPGRAPLALWVALLDVIPLVGLVLGAAPLVLLAATTASWQGAVGVTLVLLAWQLFEALRLQRMVEARSLHLGPFVTLAVGMIGLELYGIGGMLVGLVFVVLLAATLDELVGHGPRSSSPAVPEPLPGAPASAGAGPE